MLMAVRWYENIPDSGLYCNWKEPLGVELYI